MVKKLFMLFVMLFFVSSASALIWSNDTFNNSLTTEFFNFTENGNLTRYLTIPTDVNFVTSATINISSNTSGEYFESESFTTTLDGAANIQGIWGNGSVFYIIDTTDQDVYEFHYNGTFIRNTNIDTALVPKDIWGNGSDFWVVDNSLNEVQHLNSTYGEIDNFDTTVFGSSLPAGIWGNGSDLWITDTGDDLVYRVNLSGSHISNFSTAAYNTNPEGIWGNGSDFWIVRDGGGAELYHTNFTGGLLETIALDPFDSASNSIHGEGDGHTLYVLDNSPDEVVFYHRNKIINPTISVDLTEFFSFTGFFNQSSLTDNFGNVLSRFLNATYQVGSNYVIPFVFHSDTPGFLGYFELAFNNNGIFRNNVTIPASPIFETEVHDFVINFSYDTNRYMDDGGFMDITTLPVDDDTPVITGVVGDRIWTNTLSIPLVNESTFINPVWTIELVINESTVDIVFMNQGFLPGFPFEENGTVLGTNITQGGGTTSIVYSIRDEETDDLITADFDVLFRWRLNASSTVTRNESFNLSGASGYTFGIAPDKRFYDDISIELAKSGYDNREFFFNEFEHNGTVQTPTLYLLNSSSADDFIFVIKDTGLRTLSDFTVKIFRDDGGGGFILVENDVTDEFGRVVFSLVLNTVKYRIEIFDENNVLVKVLPAVLAICTTTPCQQEIIVGGEVDFFDPFDELEDYSAELTFNNNTRVVSFVWADNRGESQTHRLEVTQTLFNGTTIVFNGTSTIDTGILSFTASTDRADYKAVAYRTVGGVQTRIDVLLFEVGSLKDIFGVEGLFWAMFLLGGAILVGLFYPPAAVILYLFGLFLLGLLDIVSMHPALWVAQLVIGGVVIYAFNK